MIKLIKVNNRWVKRSELPKTENVETYTNRIILGEGNDVANEYILPSECKEYLLQRESIGKLKNALGSSLYREWVKETITGY